VNASRPRTTSRRLSGDPRNRSQHRRSSSRRSIAWLRKQSGGLQRAREHLRPVRTRRASNAQLVGGALPTLQSLPERAQEPAAKTVVKAYELRARVSRLFVTRFGRCGLAVLVRRAASRLPVGCGHYDAPDDANLAELVRPPYAPAWRISHLGGVAWVRPLGGGLLC